MLGQPGAAQHRPAAQRAAPAAAELRCQLRRVHIFDRLFGAVHRGPGFGLWPHIISLPHSHTTGPRQSGKHGKPWELSWPTSHPLRTFRRGPYLGVEPAHTLLQVSWQQALLRGTAGVLKSTALPQLEQTPMHAFGLPN